MQLKSVKNALLSLYDKKKAAVLCHNFSRSTCYLLKCVKLEILKKNYNKAYCVIDYDNFIIIKIAQ